MQKFKACMKRLGEIQRRLTTNSWCIKASCAGGLPKEIQPRINQRRSAWKKEMGCRAAVLSDAAPPSGGKSASAAKELLDILGKLFCGDVVGRHKPQSSLGVKDVGKGGVVYGVGEGVLWIR